VVKKYSLRGFRVGCMHTNRHGSRGRTWQVDSFMVAIDDPLQIEGRECFQGPLPRKGDHKIKAAYLARDIPGRRKIR
jgi:hypothetical protein